MRLGPNPVLSTFLMKCFAGQDEIRFKIKMQIKSSKAKHIQLIIRLIFWARKFIILPDIGQRDEKATGDQGCRLQGIGERGNWQNYP